MNLCIRRGLVGIGQSSSVELSKFKLIEETSDGKAECK